MSAQSKMDLPDDSLLVLRVLHARSPGSSNAFTVTVKVGRPHWVEKGIEAACPVTVDGLYGRQPDIRGIDPFDALRNAILLVESLLTGALEEYEISWPGGEPFEPA